MSFSFDLQLEEIAQDWGSEEAWNRYVTVFADVFAGRFDVYATAFPHPTKPGKVQYAKREEPLTPAVLRAHLEGRHRVGIYPLVDGYVRWAAIDFDAPKELLLRAEDDGGVPTTDEIFAAAWSDAETQAKAFEQAGLFPYLERSRSARGVHLWLFFEEPVLATTVLTGLLPLLVNADSFDRMYPVQDQVQKGGYGNLIALPLHGGSLGEGNAVFIDRETMHPLDPYGFMRAVRFNNRYVIEELAKNAPKERTGRLRTVGKNAGIGTASPEEREFSEITFDGRPDRPLRGFLKLVSPFGCKFMHHCATKQATQEVSQTQWWVAIGQATCFEHGRDAAHLLSMDDPRYDASEVDATFDRISQQTPHGCEYIRANFPELACKNCPTPAAPYHKAKLPILELARGALAPLARPDFRRHLKHIRARATGKVSSGIRIPVPGIDKWVLARTDYAVIGARPSIGKTAQAVHMAVATARGGTPVMFFSGETGEVPLLDRFIAHAADVDSKLLRGEGVRQLTAEEWSRIEAATRELEQLPLYVNYAATRADQIFALIEDIVLMERIPLTQPYLVMQDYLQFGNSTDSAGGDSEYTRLSKVSTEFKLIGLILQQAFLTFSQVKRETEGEDKPDLSWFRGTGQIEQDATKAGILTGERIPGATAAREFHGVKDKDGDAGWSESMILHQAVSRFESLAADPNVTRANPFPHRKDAGEVISGHPAGD